MQWVHHLSDESRQALKDMRLPLLAAKGTADHAPALLQGGHSHVAARLNKQVTCQYGHDAHPEARGTWEGYPSWPFEVTYNASGFGPYPFWPMSGPMGGVPGENVPMQVWWSAVLNAERMDHNGLCDLDPGAGWT